MIYKTEAEWTDDIIQRFWNYKATENHPYFTEQVGHGLIKLLKKQIDLKGKILDYGCGTGTLINFIANDNKNNEIYGLDFSRDSVLKSIEKNKNNNNVKIIINFSELDKHFKDNSFDMIFFIETIEHLRTEVLNDTFKILNRLLKNNGYLFVTTPYNEDLHNNIVYCPFCDASFHHMQHLQTFNKESLNSLFTKHNFTPLKLENTDFLYYENIFAYYKLHLKWWLKYKLGISNRIPFQKKHLYGLAKKN